MLHIEESKNLDLRRFGKNTYRKDMNAAEEKGKEEGGETENSVVRTTAQSLTWEEQSIAKENIGSSAPYETGEYLNITGTFSWITKEFTEQEDIDILKSIPDGDYYNDSTYRYIIETNFGDNYTVLAKSTYTVGGITTISLNNNALPFGSEDANIELELDSTTYKVLDSYWGFTNNPKRSVSNAHLLSNIIAELYIPSNSNVVQGADIYYNGVVSNLLAPAVCYALISKTTVTFKASINGYSEERIQDFTWDESNKWWNGVILGIVAIDSSDESNPLVLAGGVG